MRDREFFSSVREPFSPDQNTFSHHYGLIGVCIVNNQAQFTPVLDAATFRKLPFKIWWREQVFAKHGVYRFTREKLVLDVANMDGVHVDPELEATYADLSRGDPFGVICGNFAGDEPPKVITTTDSMKPKHPERAAIRQIAHEVFKTLWPDYIEISVQPEFSFGEISVKFHRVNDSNKAPASEIDPEKCR